MKVRGFQPLPTGNVTTTAPVTSIIPNSDGVRILLSLSTSPVITSIVVTQQQTLVQLIVAIIGLSSLIGTFAVAFKFGEKVHSKIWKPKQPLPVLDAPANPRAPVDSATPRVSNATAESPHSSLNISDGIISPEEKQADVGPLSEKQTPPVVDADAVNSPPVLRRCLPAIASASRRLICSKRSLDEPPHSNAEGTAAPPTAGVDGATLESTGSIILEDATASAVPTGEPSDSLAPQFITVRGTDLTGSVHKGMNGRRALTTLKGRSDPSKAQLGRAVSTGRLGISPPSSFGTATVEFSEAAPLSSVRTASHTTAAVPSSARPSENNGSVTRLSAELAPSEPHAIPALFTDVQTHGSVLPSPLPTSLRSPQVAASQPSSTI